MELEHKEHYEDQINKLNSVIEAHEQVNSAYKLEIKSMDRVMEMYRLQHLEDQASLKKSKDFLYKVNQFLCRLLAKFGVF